MWKMRSVFKRVDWLIIIPPYVSVLLGFCDGQKLKNYRWTVSEGFPSQDVISAYKNPQVKMLKINTVRLTSDEIRISSEP